VGLLSREKISNGEKSIKKSRKKISGEAYDKKKQANSIYSAKIKNRIKGAECPRAFQLSNEQYRTTSKQTDRHQESQAANSRDQIESKKVAHTRLPSVGFWS